MGLKQRCRLQKLTSPNWKYGFKIQNKIADYINKNGGRFICSLPKDTQINSGPIAVSPGEYFVIVNESILKKTELNPGDEFEVTFAIDTRPLGIDIPPEFLEVKEEFSKAAELFEALTPGKQRALINLVLKVKSKDIRIRKSIVIFQHLEKQVGKLDFKQLNQDFKNK